MKRISPKSRIRGAFSRSQKRRDGVDFIGKRGSKTIELRIVEILEREPNHPLVLLRVDDYREIVIRAGAAPIELGGGITVGVSPFLPNRPGAVKMQYFAPTFYYKPKTVEY